MIRSPEILKVLEAAPLFRGVPRELLVRNLSRSNLRNLNSGEILLAPGHLNSLVYIILSGRLSLQSKDSHVEPIAMFGEGECVGELSILNNNRFSAYVVAATDCKLLGVDHDALWNLVDNSNAAARNMLGMLAKRDHVAKQAAAESLERHQGFSGVSIVDELTGLYNRNWMHEKFERYLQRSIFSKSPGCLMMLEMDRFEEFNYRYGQLGSDQALRDIAFAVLAHMRPDDQAGHYLDKQFAVFMPNTSLPNACIAADRLKAAIGNTMVALPSGDALPSVSVSVGISQVQLKHDTLDSLFARASEALQHAKEIGGNCVKCVK